jgi:hypothetical protein
LLERGNLVGLVRASTGLYLRITPGFWNDAGSRVCIGI